MVEFYGKDMKTVSFIIFIPVFIICERGILMIQDTELALADALKKMMQEKPLDRITISDLAETAGINRQTFYYHYHDIYEVVEGIFARMAHTAFEMCSDFDTWKGGLSSLLNRMKEEQTFVEHCIRVMPRQQMEMTLYPIFEETVTAVMRDTSAEMILRDGELELITSFFKYALTGVVLCWADHGMQEDVSFLAERIYLLVRDGMIGAVSGFMHLN